MKRFILWLIHPVVVRLMHKVDRRAKCPACGTVKKHKIEWHPSYLRIMHICAICHATWGSNPVVPATAWRVVSGPELEAEQEQGKGTK
jgi:hypothetical protein